MEGKWQTKKKKGNNQIRVEIKEMENGKVVEQNNNTKSWCFQRIDTIDKALARLIKKNTENINCQYKYQK